MKQSRTMSLVEAIANVVVGYGVAVMAQMLVFPVFGLQTTLVQNLKLGGIFSLVSIARSFALRRIFEAIRARRSINETATPLRRRHRTSVVFRRQFGKSDLDQNPFRK
jgi:hypothetical protein